MSPRTALARQQAALLAVVRDHHLCTDESLSARLSELGETVDRTTIVKWRSGERQAPLGLLPILLGHVDHPETVLDALARPLGLRVVSADDVSVVGDYRDEAGDVSVALGALTSAVRAGADPGTVRRLADALVREANEAATAAGIASAK